MLSSYPPDWWWVQEMLAQTQVCLKFLFVLVLIVVVVGLFKAAKNVRLSLFPSAGPAPGGVDKDWLSKLPLLCSPSPLEVQ